VYAVLITLLLFAALAFVAVNTNWNVAQTKVTTDLVPKIGTELMTTYLLPFEAVLLLLLGALVGAIVIARE
jgi:NADH:ubiquinone oxidoreductase subunit 6 (subunit J)